MKIEQEKPEFKPVTITLETQEEVNFIASLAGHCPTLIIEKLFNLEVGSVGSYYRQLEKYSTEIKYIRITT